MGLVIHQVEHNREDFDLGPESMAALWAMEERHFWHQARNRWIRAALREAGVAPPASFLEVGCGSGAVAGYLQRQGYRVTGVDTEVRLLRKAHQRCPEASFVAVAADQLPAPPRPFAAVGFFDVLEHLTAPAELLRVGLRHAAPGALVLVTVPALGELYSQFDALSGHKRRYEPGELAALLHEAGLVEVEERGLFRATLPLLRRVRRGTVAAPAAPPAALNDPARREAALVRALRVPPWPVNLALAGLCRLEEALLFGRSRDQRGATLLGLGRLRSSG